MYFCRNLTSNDLSCRYIFFYWRNHMSYLSSWILLLDSWNNLYLDANLTLSCRYYMLSRRIEHFPRLSFKRLPCRLLLPCWNHLTNSLSSRNLLSSTRLTIYSRMLLNSCWILDFICSLIILRKSLFTRILLLSWLNNLN